MQISINIEILFASKKKYFHISFSFTPSMKCIFIQFFKILMIFFDRMIIALHKNIKFIKIGQFTAKLSTLRLPLPQIEMSFLWAGPLQMGIFSIVEMTLLLINIYAMYHETLGIRKISKKLYLGVFEKVDIGFYIIVTLQIKIFSFSI